MNFRRTAFRGFTLIELMLVVAIIGLLAAIAIPKFANLVTKSNEAAIKGNLGALRSAFSLYYSDNEGFLPTNMSPGDFYLGKYIDKIPLPLLPGHQDPMINMLLIANDPACTLVADDTGWTQTAWLLCSQRGTVIIDCVHTDSKGGWVSQW